MFKGHLSAHIAGDSYEDPETFLSQYLNAIGIQSVEVKNVAKHQSSGQLLGILNIQPKNNAVIETSRWVLGGFRWLVSDAAFKGMVMDPENPLRIHRVLKWNLQVSADHGFSVSR